MGICEVNQFDQSESSNCLIFDRCKDERFNEFKFPVVYDGRMYKRCLRIYHPRVVVVNSTGLKRYDIEVLMESDKKNSGTIVFVILSEGDTGAAQILHEKLTTVRKLKLDCSNNILDFSIQYSIKWGPSGYLKKGRISNDQCQVEGPMDYFFMNPDLEQTYFYEEKKEIDAFLQVARRIGTSRITKAVLALSIFLSAAIFVLKPVELTVANVELESPESIAISDVGKYKREELKTKKMSRGSSEAVMTESIGVKKAHTVKTVSKVSQEPQVTEKRVPSILSEQMESPAPSIVLVQSDPD